MSVKKILIVLTIQLMIVTGCVSEPKNNSAYRSIESVYVLQGTYKNIGESGESLQHGVAIDLHGAPQYVGEDGIVESYYPIYLSKIIWPSDPTINHEAINFIKVRAINSTSLEVMALSKHGVDKVDVFTEGQQFNLHDGRISLKHEFRLVGMTGGDIMVGTVYGNVELGIDQLGNGKYRSETGVAGLVFMVMPIAVVGREDIRFVKVEP